MRIDATTSHPALLDPSKAKLVDAARQFESMMLQEMLKPLKFGSSDAGDDSGSDGGGAADTIRGFATEAVGKAISAGGGFGLARQIIRQVQQEREQKQSRGEGTKVA